MSTSEGLIERMMRNNPDIKREKIVALKWTPKMGPGP